MSNDPLTSLVSIISTSVENLQSEYAKRGLTVPRLDETSPAGSLDNDSQVKEAIKLITAAAAQLIATVRTPDDTIWEIAPSMYMSALLGFVVEVNIPEMINEAAEKSLHAEDIAAKAGCDPSHVSRVLRYLAIRHIFREITPNVFANNRISSALIRANKKSVADSKQLQEKPLEEYINSDLAATAGHAAQEGLRSSTALVDFLKSGGEVAEAPFNLAFDTKSTFWEWLSSSESQWRMKRFSAVVQSFTKGFGNETFIKAYDWGNLTFKDVIVDVGGNIGTVTLDLAKTFEEPRYIIQDFPSVITQAKIFWEGAYPEAIADGRVKFSSHDILTPQPVQGAAVYFLRIVIHDFSDADSIKILQNIRNAASSSSRLILFELSVSYASKAPTEYYSSLVESQTAPYPLLPNYRMGLKPTFADIQVMTFANGRQRDFGQFVALGEASGWRLEAVKMNELSAFIFVPA